MKYLLMQLFVLIFYIVDHYRIFEIIYNNGHYQGKGKNLYLKELLISKEKINKKSIKKESFIKDL